MAKMGGWMVIKADEKPIKVGLTRLFSPPRVKYKPRSSVKILFHSPAAVGSY